MAPNGDERHWQVLPVNRFVDVRERYAEYRRAHDLTVLVAPPFVSSHSTAANHR